MLDVKLLNFLIQLINLIDGPDFGTLQRLSGGGWFPYLVDILDNLTAAYLWIKLTVLVDVDRTFDGDILIDIVNHYVGG
jgi:hypothetical protein